MPKVGWADMFDVQSDDDLFEALCATIRSRVPKFKIRYKRGNAWQRFLGTLLFFIRGNAYMEEFTTTLGSTVWFPSEEFVEADRWKAFKILAHEYLHLMDRQSRPVFFEFLYAMPQLLSILSVLALMAFFFGAWWLMALLALVFLAPIPALGRMGLEQRGYAMGLAINIWRHGTIRQEKRDYLHDVFEGSAYYWMWPYKKDIDEWIDKTERLVRNVDKIKPDATIFEESVAYLDVYELLTGISFEH